jgi:hypothetical protein
MIASPARNTRFNSNSVANLDVLDLAAYLDDGSSALVTKDDGAFKNKIPDAPTLPVVDIAATDASLLNVNSNIVLITETWDRTFLERHVSDGL